MCIRDSRSPVRNSGSFGNIKRNFDTCKSNRRARDHTQSRQFCRPNPVGYWHHQQNNSASQDLQSLERPPMAIHLDARVRSLFATRLPHQFDRENSTGDPMVPPARVDLRETNSSRKRKRLRQFCDPIRSLKGRLRGYAFSSRPTFRLSLIHISEPTRPY